MSSYVNFFIHYNDDMIPISSYCRSSQIYQNFYDTLYCGANYGKAYAVTQVDLERVSHHITEQINDYTKRIDFYKERIAFITSLTNSVEEKVEQYDDMTTTISDLQEEIAALETARNFIGFLIDIIIEAGFDKRDENHCIYFGFEVEYDENTHKPIIG